MAATGRIGVSGVDTRALTRLVRREGPPTVAFAHSAKGEFDLRRCRSRRRNGPGWRGWTWRKRFRASSSRPGAGASGGLGRGMRSGLDCAQHERGRDCPSKDSRPVPSGRGAQVAPTSWRSIMAPKHNIFRNLVAAGARVTIVPAGASFDEVMAHEPDGFFLSNGPGDPAATGEYAVPLIQAIARHGQALVRNLPWPSIACARGRRQNGKNVPGPPRRQPSGQAAHRRRGRDHQHEPRLRGRARGLAANVRETHVSLFDGSNCGLELTDKPAFSVQYHPEASPGPQDSFYLFEKFVGMMR